MRRENKTVKNRKLRRLAERIEKERTRIDQLAVEKALTDETLIKEMGPIENMINDYMRMWQLIDFTSLHT